MAVKPVKFTLKDIGSEVVDQLSKDIYSDRGAIFRELTKNAYDAYLLLPDGVLEDEEQAREIVLARSAIPPKTRKIAVTDYGIGQDLTDVKGFVQIGIAHKKDVDAATGFRGLGSWAIMGSGAVVRVVTSKYGKANAVTLTLNVREIYKKLDPTVSLDEILNDPDLIQFEEEPADKADHYTTVEILCDGPTSTVNGYEINRLWDYADPTDTTLRDELIRYCAVPFTSTGDAYKVIHKLYKAANYIPTPIRLDGVTLEKTLPPNLTIETDKIRLNGGIAAYYWHASNAAKKGMLKEEELKQHNQSGTSIQLCRYNVPIGSRDKYNDSTRTTNDWFVGEIHIVADDLLPNAGGDDLREGANRQAFVAEIKSFYKQLEDDSVVKSKKLSALDHIRKALPAIEKLRHRPAPTGVEHADLTQTVAAAVKVLEEAGDRKRSKNDIQRRYREALGEPEAKGLLGQLRKALKTVGGAEAFSRKSGGRGAKKNVRRGKAQGQTAGGAPTGVADRLGDIQARLGRAMPQLRVAGFTEEEITTIIRIMENVLR